MADMNSGDLGHQGTFFQTVEIASKLIGAGFGKDTENRTNMAWVFRNMLTVYELFSRLPGRDFRDLRGCQKFLTLVSVLSGQPGEEDHCPCKSRCFKGVGRGSKGIQAGNPLSTTQLTVNDGV
jgi:hypothetical protein